MSAYIYRHIIFVPLAARASANAVAASIDPDEGGEDTFSVRLSPTRVEPVTHYGCDSAATEAMRMGMLSALSGVTASYWRIEAATGVLQSTNVPLSVARQGQPFTFHDALADAGLQVVQPAGGFP